MNYERFEAMTARYPRLRIGVVGDLCLDRYLEIDPARAEESIETGLPVYNVVDVRSQSGAAGTILNNLVALGVGEIAIVGLCGEDGEGYELERALQGMTGVDLDGLVHTPHRHTFVYCKPLVMTPGQPPRELNRLDTKNWSPTPTVLQRYDVDGLELDWMRTPSNFNDDEIESGREMLTDFMRAARRKTQATAARRGHPVQLTVRVPARPEFARGLGFDAVAWAREGLLDAVERGYNSVELTVEHGGPQTVFWMEILIDPAPTNR